MGVKDKLLAYELYVKQNVLDNDDLKKLFKVTSTSTVQKIKKPILQHMEDNGILMPIGYVHLESAYKVYDVDIKSLEANYAKAKKYGIA